jgi:hypothetical protein
LGEAYEKPNIFGEPSSFLAGSYDFQVSELEVYQVVKV